MLVEFQVQPELRILEREKFPKSLGHYVDCRKFGTQLIRGTVKEHGRAVRAFKVSGLPRGRRITDRCATVNAFQANGFYIGEFRADAINGGHA